MSPSNPPLHSPLYVSVSAYEGECEGISVLLAVDEEAIRQVLSYTPFEYLSAHAWIEVFMYRNTARMAPYHDTFGPPYSSFGVVIPARFRDTVGGYYAHCYKNKDYGAMLGREIGFPVKSAEVHFQHTGRAVTSSVQCPTAVARVSAVVGAGRETIPVEAPHSPTLLIQSLPDVETDGVLLRQVIARDVGASSTLDSTHAEAAFELLPAPSTVDDLGWLAGAEPLYAQHVEGVFRGTTGRVLSTDFASPELVDRINALSSDQVPT